MKIYGIVTNVGTEEDTSTVVTISLNLEKLIDSLLSDYNGDCIIKCLNLDSDKLYDTHVSIFSCNEKLPDYWKPYYGIEKEYTWKNKITGELDPDFEDRKNPDYDNWVDGCWCKEYRYGTIVREYFE